MNFGSCKKASNKRKRKGREGRGTGGSKVRKKCIEERVRGEWRGRGSRGEWGRMETYIGKTSDFNVLDVDTP